MTERYDEAEVAEVADRAAGAEVGLARATTRRPTRARRPTPPRLAMVAAAIALGCAEPPGSYDPTILNGSATPLYIVAMGADAATRYDPAPSLELEPDDRRVLPPGASRSLPAAEIMEHRPDEGVMLFLYAVDGTRATFRDTRVVPPEAFREPDWLVEILL